MKKIFTLVAAVAVLAACNTNNPDTPEEQKKAAFAKAQLFEAVGTNTVPNVEGENKDRPFVIDSVRVEAVIVTDSTLDIRLYGINFSSKMPVTIDMVIPGAHYSRTADLIRISGEGLVPTMGDRPFDRYIITGLTGTITCDSLRLRNNYGQYSDCTFAGHITALTE